MSCGSKQARPRSGASLIQSSGLAHLLQIAYLKGTQFPTLWVVLFQEALGLAHSFTFSARGEKRCWGPGA